MHYGYYKGTRILYFFHQKAKNRKSKNDIKGFSGGAGLITDLGIEKTVLNYFDDTFHAGCLGGGVDVLQSIESWVTP